MSERVHVSGIGGVGMSGFGAYHGRWGFDRFSHLKPVFLQSRLGGAPLLDGAAAVFECRPRSRYPEGDHVILVGEVLRVIRQLAEEGNTMILVTHEMQFAREVSNKVMFLHRGVVEEEGPPAVLFGHPRSDRLRQFLARTF